MPTTTSSCISHVSTIGPPHSTPFLLHFYFPASEQAVVTGVVPSPPRVLPQRLSRIGFSNSILLVDFPSSVANSRSIALRKSLYAPEKSLQNYANMHRGGLELTKLTYTRLEDNLIRHLGDSTDY